MDSCIQYHNKTDLMRKRSGSLSLPNEDSGDPCVIALNVPPWPCAGWRQGCASPHQQMGRSSLVTQSVVLEYRAPATSALPP